MRTTNVEIIITFLGVIEKNGGMLQYLWLVSFPIFGLLSLQCCLEIFMLLLYILTRENDRGIR